VFKSPLIAVFSAALLMSGVSAPAFAESQQSQQQSQGRGDVSDETRDNLRDRQSQPEIGGRTGRVQRNNRSRPAAGPTPEENLAAAQAIATAAASPCQVTAANLLGQTAEGAKSYEAACATGPGYIFISTTPPQAVDCILLAGQAEIDRARDPAADVGTQCTLPQNTDVLRVLTAYATEAGVPCAVDQGASIGKSASGNLIYEVGCNGVDGYWLEKSATGWTTTECSVITTQNAACRYSTAAEAAATLKARFAGSDVADCDVTQARYMGANANGSFYEAKCGAGNGVIVRFNPEFAVQQVYACEVAQRIGGGCTLTVVPAAPAAETAPQQ
jgi:hypothetical protein